MTFVPGRPTVNAGARPPDRHAVARPARRRASLPDGSGSARRRPRPALPRPARPAEAGRSSAGGAAPDDGHVGEVGEKAGRRLEGGDDGGTLVGTDLDRRAAVPAVQMTMLCLRPNVERFAAVGAVAVPDETELFEDGERPVHGRGDRRRIDGPAALDELGPGDVAARRGEDLDEGPPLWRPAQPPGPEALADAGPRTDPAAGLGRRGRAGRGRRCRIRPSFVALHRRRGYAAP